MAQYVELAARLELDATALLSGNGARPMPQAPSEPEKTEEKKEEE